MNDTIQTLAERLAEALHGNTTTIQTPMGLIILAPLPGSSPAPVVATPPPVVEPPKAKPVEAPMAEAITPSALRDLARQAAAKVGADQVRAALGKPILEIKPSEAVAVAARLRALL
jgi:hypothetical protein